MIDILIILISLIAIILFDLLILPSDDLRRLIQAIIINAVLYYIGFNINSVDMSKVFLALALITSLLIPIIAILQYIEKIKT